MSVDGLETVGSKRRDFNWLGLVAFTLLMLAASVSHGAVFGDWSGYIAAMGGTLLAVGLLASLMRWGCGGWKLFWPW